MADDQDAMIEVMKEDGDYFKDLLSLVPHLVPSEVTQKRQLDSGEADAPSKKKKKQKKKNVGNASNEPKPKENKVSLQEANPVKKGAKKRQAAQLEDESEEMESADFATVLDTGPSPKKRKTGKDKKEDSQVPGPKQRKDTKVRKERATESMMKAINGSATTLDSNAELKERLHAKILETQATKSLSVKAGREKKVKKKEKKKNKLKKQKEEKAKKKAAEEGEKIEEEKSTANAAAPKKPLFNMKGALMFNRLNFDHKGEKDKAGRSELVGKDYKRILEKLEKRQKKVLQIRDKDQDSAKALEEKMAWQDAVSKAAGVKVKDNEVLVKKSLKRKMKIKEKRKKKWTDREKTVKENLKKKQEKRQKNIEERKQSKRQTKYKKMVKKGRILPGFDNN